jgi:hypothetical protein
MLQVDSNPEFFYDRAAKRYRYRDSKKFAPKKAILNLTKDYIKSEQSNLESLASKYFNGQISLLEFQTQSASHLKHLHISSLILGKDGVENVTGNDFLAVGRILKEQYYDGKGKDGKPFGLKHLTQELASGNVSQAQLKNRLALYGKSAQQSYWLGKTETAKNDQKTFAIRKLGATDRHCQSCLSYSALPPQPLNLVILPGQKCECRSNCKCHLEFMTLAEAVRLGASIQDTPA